METITNYLTNHWNSLGFTRQLIVLGIIATYCMYIAIYLIGYSRTFNKVIRVIFNKTIRFFQFLLFFIASIIKIVLGIIEMIFSLINKFQSALYELSLYDFELKNEYRKTV